MKQSFGASKGRNAKNVAALQLLRRLTWKKASLFYLVVLLTTLLFIGCKKQDIDVSENKTETISHKAMNTDEEFRKSNSKLGLRTLWELLQARAATARYRNIKNAIKDGYTDINVVVPNMGHHYMKSAFVDATFEIRKPEILVYNKHENGYFQLVAVEYAVPINLSPNAAPEGFTGAGDMWDRNTGFGLWLLHAWVWYYNPDGVFNPTNPLVHMH